MSGHSKWSQIKRSKGAADVKRGAVFSKLIKTVILAAKTGANPELNPSLKMAIERARQANMPKENIDRAIAKASGAEGVQLQEVLFEAYGPVGVAFLIQAVTDNNNRTTAEVRHVLRDYDGKLADSGSVSYLFSQKGWLLLEVPAEKVEQAELDIIDSGADDFDAEDGQIHIYTQSKELEKVRKFLEEKGYAIQEHDLVWEPNTTIQVDQTTGEKLITISEKLEELEDVTKVAANFDII